MIHHSEAKPTLTLYLPVTKIAEFANSVDLDEVAHNEPPHLDLHCLPSSLWILNMMQLGLNIFWKFADENFVVCFSVVKELNRDVPSLTVSRAT